MRNLLFVSCLVSIIPVAHSMENDTYNPKITITQDENVTQEKTVLDQYYDLFLSPVEKLLLKGVRGQDIKEAVRQELRKKNLRSVQSNLLKNYYNNPCEETVRFTPSFLRRYFYNKVPTASKDLTDEQNVFIKNNPVFFVLHKKLLEKLVGLTSSEKKLGDGVIVGVIDNFSKDFEKLFSSEQSSLKILNARLKSESHPGVFDRGPKAQTDEGSHGFHVSGTIASTRNRKKWGTLGIAPNAIIHPMNTNYLDAHLDPQKITNLPQAIPNWTSVQMANLLKQLWNDNSAEVVEFYKNNFYKTSITIDKNLLVDNHIIASGASLFNVSLTFSKNTPENNRIENIEALPIYIYTMREQKKLWVFALGNKSVFLDTTDLFRIEKALARCEETAPYALFVVNIMRDGLTLDPTSNAPGDDSYLQARTLCAPGSDIKSTVFETSTSEGTRRMTGTSMAAPHVSGVAAIVLSNCPHLTGDQLSTCLLQGATPLVVFDDGTPYALENMTVEQLEKAFFNQNTIPVSNKNITMEDVARGRRLYGMGRVNCEGALEYAKTHFSSQEQRGNGH